MKDVVLRYKMISSKYDNNPGGICGHGHMLVLLLALGHLGKASRDSCSARHVCSTSAAAATVAIVAAVPAA